jgi:tetratricopeptide (TPR) repeat protein
MVTIRTYSNAAEAAMAKSLLDSNDIFCRLADENANLYGGGPMAMPIRLLVAEDQAEKASRILESKGPELPDDFDPGIDQNLAKGANSVNERILSELRGLSGKHQWTMLLSVAVLILAVYLVIELPRRATSPWDKVDEAMEKHDYKTALSLAKKTLAQNPSLYYTHAYLGNIYLEMGDLDRAEAEYLRARELSPPPYLEERLKLVRERREQESRIRAAAAPLPSP